MGPHGVGGRGPAVTVARRLVPASVVATLALVVTTPAPAHPYQRPGTFQLVSVSSTGQHGNGDSGWGASAGTGGMGVSMSPDGRFVAFASMASNLVANDTNNLADVFVRDRARGRTTMASVPTASSLNPLGTGGLGVLCSGSQAPAISANGRYVAFSSCDINLVGIGKDLNAADDIFLHDMKTGLTSMVSVASNGDQSNVGAGSWSPTISADGRYVAFESTATNFAEVCPAGQSAACTIAGLTQVYVRDLKRHTTRLVSATASGGVANGASFDAAISPDGRYVAFVTYADNLTNVDLNYSGTNPFAVPSAPDVYLKDLKTGGVRLVSVATTGRAPVGGPFPESGARTDHGPRTLAVSPDDRYVVFGSSATDLVPNGAGGGIFVRDLTRNRTERVSVNSAGESYDGTQTAGGCGVGQDATISATGRYVAFACTPDPTCKNTFLYATVYDRVTGTLDAVSMEDNLPGTPNGCAHAPATATDDFNAQISPDGRLVAFASNKRTLTRGDVQKNSGGQNAFDVFVRDRGPTLGVGATRAGLVSLAGAPAFAGTGVATAVDPTADVDTAETAQGADLTGATVVYRPERRDLFVRLDVSRMPSYLLATPALVYGLDLVAHGVRYQVRAARTGTGAAFGLFRRTGTGWVQVAPLHGGYGTTGQQVVVAVPLAAIGARHGGRLRHVQAFTGVGSYLTGAVRTIDIVGL